MLVDVVVEVEVMVVVPKANPKRLAEKPSGKEKPDCTSRPTTSPVVLSSALATCLESVDL